MLSFHVNGGVEQREKNVRARACVTATLPDQRLQREIRGESTEYFSLIDNSSSKCAGEPQAYKREKESNERLSPKVFTHFYNASNSHTRIRSCG